MGMFNEKYVDCWEDVDFNMNLIIKGYKNFINSDCVAYHFESKTRKNNFNEENSLYDYNTHIIPLFKNNFEKLKKYTYVR